ncbi:hypothetical protein PGIGA_G00116680 [Pangasianodon gigas]|uniref:Uncharacterized protein n=1 Tax=Pangasianodon gigas TaxID=30993 RepID=A0ACC5XFI1_PANGG|nr:hypothetical protein [Pangasianodon gigas]
MSRRSGVQSVFQFIPKVFSGVEVRALCRTLEFFHSNLHTPCLHGARFVHRGIVMLEQVMLEHTHILYNRVRQTFQQFGEEQHVGVMFRISEVSWWKVNLFSSSSKPEQLLLVNHL